MPTTKEPPPPDFDENPEWTAEDFAAARPFHEVFPDLYTSWQRTRGRPPIEHPKKHISFRLPPDLVDGIRASGAGYNRRVEQVLREALATGKL
jgi:uncharacterized protein (DUF4415 family)